MNVQKNSETYFFTSSNWVIMSWKQRKIFICQRWRHGWSQYSLPDCLRNITLVARILTIRQGQIDLRLWIMKPCCKPSSQIRQVILGECQTNSPSDSRLWFFTFITFAKTSSAAELGLMYYQNIAKIMTHPSNWNWTTPHTHRVNWTPHTHIHVKLTPPSYTNIKLEINKLYKVFFNVFYYLDHLENF